MSRLYHTLKKDLARFWDKSREQIYKISSCYWKWQDTSVQQRNARQSLQTGKAEAPKIQRENWWEDIEIYLMREV